MSFVPSNDEKDNRPSSLTSVLTPASARRAFKSPNVSSLPISIVVLHH